MLRRGKGQSSIVQDNAQKGTVDLESAIVVNEAQFPEFIHKKIHPRARGADHFRQRLLRYFGKRRLRLALLALAREQQKSAGQPFLAGVKKLIDQVLFDADVP
jgi:hypothetical protein